MCEFFWNNNLARENSGGNRGYRTLGANRDVLEEGEALHITKLCIFLAKCTSWTISLPVLINYRPSFKNICTV
jgi:hypothetical protein